MKLYHEKVHIIKIEDFSNYLFKNTVGGVISESVQLTELGVSEEVIVKYWREVGGFIGTQNRLALDFDAENNSIIAYEFDAVSKYKNAGVAYYDDTVGKYYIEVET